MAVRRAPSKKARAQESRRPKKNPLFAAKIEYVDYKDVNLLQRFMSDRSKIRSRRVSGNSTQQQREVATAVKNAREMALLPYAKRVATTRTTRPPKDSDGGDRRGPAPQQQAAPEAPAVEVDVVEEAGE